jgi:NADPH:quinone reductase-like Zn-dependent oxidoreductase
MSTTSAEPGTTMEAVVQDAYGPTDVLRLGDVPRPAIGGREVLVRVRAAGVDPGVWHLLTGRPYLVRAMGYGLRRPKVRVRGSDLAGVVEAVGREVTRFRPGDAVMGTCDGSFAEYAAAHEDRLAAKPDALTFVQAAAVPVSASAALQALRDQGGVQPGQRVLIMGASGGVGSFAVQLAKAFGAEVTGVCRGAKADLVRALGADHVVDHTREDALDGPRRYDLVLDIGGTRPLSHLRRALTPRGTLVFVGGEGGGRWLGGTSRQLLAVAIGPFVRQRLRVFVSGERHEDLEVLAGMIAAGAVTPAVDRTYPLAEAAAAIRYLADGHARGKVVLTV